MPRAQPAARLLRAGRGDEQRGRDEERDDEQGKQGFDSHVDL
ncbi:MAG: hypothetical protein ACRD9R_07025 [Pyrinomonadaceae bacterium]